MQGPKETKPHVVETTSCVHETGCVTLRNALIVDGLPERSASSTDAIPHLYLKSNQNAWFCLLIWHHECLCSSFAQFETETEKRTLLEDLSLSEGAETAMGTIHLRWTCCMTCVGVRVNRYALTSVLDGVEWSHTLTTLPPGTEPLRSYHWSHRTRWLLGPENFDKRKISSRYPAKNSDLLRYLQDSKNGELLYCKPLSPQWHTKFQALGVIRCGRCCIQALRPRYVLC